MSYIYNEPKNIDKSEFLKIVAAEETSSICDATIRAAYFINDYDWLISQYKLLINHPDINIRRVTITCIGHLSRLNESAKKDELLNILEPLLSDENLAGSVEDAIDDIKTFL